jgi:TonB family protein
MGRPVRQRRLGGFFGLSLLLHLHLALLIATVISLNPDGCAHSDVPFAPLEVSLVPEDEVIRDKKELKEELKQEEKEEEKKEKDAKGQVVDLPPPAEEKQPEKSRFLSEYDSKVKRETKGRPVPFRPGRVVANRPVPKQMTAKPPSPQQQREVERKVMRLAMRTQPDLPKSQLEQHDSGDEPVKTETPPDKAPKGPKMPDQKEAGPRKRITMRDLQLSDKELLKALGTRVNDYLKDVEEGDQTLLNSKRWRFASFFNRVKRQVAQNWHPDVVYRRRDPTGNVYGFRDRLTILRVRLTPEGRLKDLHLEKACGVGFLDDEAISAFRAAEPFPNPPKGLVDKDTGMISFRFGFLFEISRRPTFRIFRYSEE